MEIEFVLLNRCSKDCSAESPRGATHKHMEEAPLDGAGTGGAEACGIGGSTDGVAPLQPYLAQQAYQVQQPQQAQEAGGAGAAASEYSEYADSGGSVSTFTQFLRDYTLRFWDPVVCVKLRKRCARPRGAVARCETT